MLERIGAGEDLGVPHVTSGGYLPLGMKNGEETRSSVFLSQRITSLSIVDKGELSTHRVRRDGKYLRRLTRTHKHLFVSCPLLKTKVFYQS